MKKLIGLSIGPLQNKYGDREALEIAKNVGADAVDFSLYSKNLSYKNPDSIYSKSDEEIVAYYKDIKDYADSLGLMISQTHSRLEGYKNIEQEDKDLLENIRRDLMVTSVLGAPTCVVHAVTPLHLGLDAEPKLIRDVNFKMFTDILPFAKKYAVKVATETFGSIARFEKCDFFANIDEFIMSYNRISSAEDFKDYFKICVDTGHSNTATRYNNPTPANVIRMLGSDIDVLHLHDNNGLTDQHKIPLTGSIDWNDVLDALDDIGYKGVYNLELELLKIGGMGMEIPTAEYAVKVMKNLLKLRYGE